MVVHTYEFYKTSAGDWFVDLPGWEGSVSELQMVMGADTLLDIMAEGSDKITLDLSLEKFPGSDMMTMLELGKIEGPEVGSGAWYFMPSWRGIDFNLRFWLCDVTKWVFGNFPETIYFNKHW
jgi:hypothetical protein